ncbi:hypothetical protein BWO76_02145 (plasmid) [Sinorhizobium meliloti]|nr:hypothetical protein BWO76_02145 [Sinorhizobium meliloti]
MQCVAASGLMAAHCGKCTSRCAGLKLLDLKTIIVVAADQGLRRSDVWTTRHWTKPFTGADLLGVINSPTEAAK